MRDITRPEVWAPRASTVSLFVHDEPQPMRRGERPGWWVSEHRLTPGTRYAFIVDGGSPRPDPRGLAQPDGPHAASEIVDPGIFDRPQWHGIDLRGGVLYELHVGTFTSEGTFDAAIDKLDLLVELGIDAVELMPVADFPGERGWGYDGVGQYATHHAYGGPESLVRFIDACHERELGVLLDVVYNHLGPEGNYLAEFGPYFTDHHTTPWGDALNLDQEDSDEIRAFFLGAAHQWLAWFQFDGLRLDAVHALADDSPQHFLAEITDAAHTWEQELGRPLFITAESDLNQPYTVSPTDSVAHARGMGAQWADDVHHALHSFFTGETQGYYVDFGSVDVLQKALTSVFIHDGNHSTFRGKRWGAPVDTHSSLYDAHSFIVGIQNHDQVGNRAAGDRLADADRQAAAAALYLLAPFTPMLFMGEEWAASTPFPFFSDLGPQLAPLVSEGRAREFAEMGWRDAVPDPQATATFVSAKLDWDEREREGHRRMLQWYRTLIALRHVLPGATDPSLATTKVSVVDADTLVMRRPGFAVAATRAQREVEVSLDGQLLGAWGEASQTASGCWRFAGPGAIIVAAE